MNAYYILRLIKETEFRHRAFMKDPGGFRAAELKTLKSVIPDFPFGGEVAQALWGFNTAYWLKHWERSDARQCLKYYDLLAAYLGYGDWVTLTERRPWQAFRQLHRWKGEVVQLDLETPDHLRKMRKDYPLWYEFVCRQLTHEFHYAQEYEVLYLEYNDLLIEAGRQLPRLQRMILREVPYSMLMVEVNHEQSAFGVFQSIHEMVIDGSDLIQTMTLQAYNPFNEPVDYYVFKVAGDRSVRYEDLILEAWVRKAHETAAHPFQIECEAKGLSKYFKIVLYFLPPFGKGDRFDLSIKCHYRGTMRSSGSDYVGTLLFYAGEVKEHKTLIRFTGSRPAYLTAVRYDLEPAVKERIYYNTDAEAFVYRPQGAGVRHLRVRFDYELPE